MNTGAPWPEPRSRPSCGYSRCRRSCTNGRRPILAVASMTLPTSSMTRRSSSWRGTGCGATRAHEPPESMGSHPAPSCFGAGELLGGLRDDLKAGRFVPQRVREKTIPKAGGQGPPPGDPDDRGPGRAGRVEAGARADLRGGLQAVLVWLPPEAPSPGRDRRDPLPRVTHLGTTSGCSRRTSRRASTRSTTPP